MSNVHSVASSGSAACFDEKDFQLPDLEIKNSADLEAMKQLKRQKSRLNFIAFEQEQEKKFLNALDLNANKSHEDLSTWRGKVDRPVKLKALRCEIEAKAELNVLSHVLTRKPGEWKDQMKIIEGTLNGLYLLVLPYKSCISIIRTFTTSQQVL